MILGVSSQFMQQVGGCNAVIYYFPILFETSIKTTHTKSMLLGGVNMVVYSVFATTSWFLIERLGRRKLLIPVPYLVTAEAKTRQGRTIRSVVVDRLRKLFKAENNVGVACTYCNYKVKDMQTLENFLAGLRIQPVHHKMPFPRMSNVVQEIYRIMCHIT